MTETNRNVDFTTAEMRRVHACARSLGTSQAEFVRFAVLNACDELEAIGRSLSNPVVGGEPTYDALWGTLASSGSSGRKIGCVSNDGSQVEQEAS